MAEASMKTVSQDSTSFMLQLTRQLQRVIKVALIDPLCCHFLMSYSANRSVQNCNNHLMFPLMMKLKQTITLSQMLPVEHIIVLFLLVKACMPRAVMSVVSQVQATQITCMSEHVCFRVYYLNRTNCTGNSPKGTNRV